MSKFEDFKFKWNTFWEEKKPVMKKIGVVCKCVGKWIYRLRGLLLSIPVAVAAIKFAVDNDARLPASVGVSLQASGEFATMIAHDTAVWFPLWVTAFCILMTVLSRRVFYPWLIAVFSLVIPYLLWITNSIPL